MLIDAATRRNLELETSLGGAQRAHARWRSWTAARPPWAAGCCAAGCNRPAARPRGAAAPASRPSSCCISARPLEPTTRVACGRSATSSASSRASRSRSRAAARPRAAARRPRCAAGAARSARGASTAARVAALAATLRRASTPTRDAAARARSSTTPPALLRDGGVIAPASTPSSTSCARSTANATSSSLELEQRERERTGIADAQGRLQQRARLLHRGRPRAGRQGAGGLHAPPDAQGRRALHHAELKAFEDKALSAPRARAGAREGALRAAAGDARRRRSRGAAADCADAHRRARRCSRTSPERERRAGSRRGPSSSTSRASTSRAAAIRCVESASSSAVHAERPRAGRRSGACWSSPARTWAASRPTCARSR